MSQVDNREEYRINTCECCGEAFRSLLDEPMDQCLDCLRDDRDPNVKYEDVDGNEVSVEIGDTFTHIRFGSVFGEHVSTMMDNEDAVKLAEAILNLNKESGK